eukprot:3489790-Heterocapsa_arctica.AAC.1
MKRRIKDRLNRVSSRPIVALNAQMRVLLLGTWASVSRAVGAQKWMRHGAPRMRRAGLGLA